MLGSTGLGAIGELGAQVPELPRDSGFPSVKGVNNVFLTMLQSRASPGLWIGRELAWDTLDNQEMEYLLWGRRKEIWFSSLNV